MASILKVDQIQLPDGSAPTASDLGVDVSGSVLQVVRATTSTEVSVSTAGVYTDIGLLATITPKSANSIILIQAIVQCRVFGSDNATSIRVLRGGTVIGDPPTNSYQVGYTDEISSATSYLVPIFEYDTPNTTSAITYNIQGANRNSVYPRKTDFQDDDEYTSSILIMEIAQ